MTPEEKALLDRITLQAITNRYTVNPKAFEPTLEECKLLHSIRIKLELNE
ncbi:MAG: hypothetical protein SOY94_10745 [Candidatus Limiplasma sp.]|nr:hypothetical protein [Candidatus Limiplasma sp.]